MALIPTLVLAGAALAPAPPPQAVPALTSITAPRRLNAAPGPPAVPKRFTSPPGLTVIGYSLDNSLIVRSPSPAPVGRADSVRAVEIPLPGGRMVVTLRRAAPEAARGGALALSPAGEAQAPAGCTLCFEGARLWLARVHELLLRAGLGPGRLLDLLLGPAPATPDLPQVYPEPAPPGLDPQRPLVDPAAAPPTSTQLTLPPGSNLKVEAANLRGSGGRGDCRAEGDVSLTWTGGRLDLRAARVTIATDDNGATHITIEPLARP